MDLHTHTPTRTESASPTVAFAAFISAAFHHRMSRIIPVPDPLFSRPLQLLALGGRYQWSSLFFLGHWARVFQWMFPAFNHSK